MTTDTKAKAIRILYYGAGWPTNIGNAFIDLGAMAILRAAVPDAQIAFASEMPRWFFAHSANGEQPKEVIKWVKRFWRFQFLYSMPQTVKLTKHQTMDNSFEVASATQCDLVVFAGMAMCEEFLLVNGPSILALSSRGIPVLLLGTGALKYNDREKETFGSFLRQVSPIGFISRDEQSYEMFAGFVTQTHKGIDCAFWVPEAYKPFSLVLDPYVVATFDTMPEPVLRLNGRPLIRAHHNCWGPPQTQYVSTSDTLISDIPYDYLTLYANAEEVHSDRVHACVAALAYGRQARFYHPTPRGSLFAAAGAERIREKLIQLDMQSFAKKKETQVKFVRQLITMHVRSQDACEST